MWLYGCVVGCLCGWLAMSLVGWLAMVALWLSLAGSVAGWLATVCGLVASCVAD